MKPVFEYMTSGTVCVKEETTILQTVDVMRQKKIGSVLINDANNNTVGIFTERDLLQKVDFKDLAKLNDAKIGEVMTKNLRTVNCEVPYTDVIKLMQQYSIRHMPIVSEGVIIGIVSLRDLMKQYEENLESMLESKQGQLLKQLEQIRQSEEKFRIIFDNSTLAIIFADKDDRIVTWNPLAAKLLGMDRELQNKPMDEIYPEGEWGNIRLGSLAHHDDHPYLNTKALNNEGELIDVEVSINMLRSDEDEIIGSVSVIRDIRQLKRISENLQKSRKELEDMKSALDEHAIVAVTDAKGRITYANDKFCTVSQYEREDLIGKDHRIVNSNYHSKDFMRNMWQTIESGQVWKGEVRNKSKDGSLYWVDTTIVPFLDEKGEPYQYVSIRTNISTRKRTEEELRLLNQDLIANEKALKDLIREKERTQQKLLDTQTQLIQTEKMATVGNLAAGIAHEIKNPLGIIFQGMERIEKNFEKMEDKSSKPFIDMVKKATERANSVVLTLLKYSRSSHLDISEVDVTQMLDEAIGLVKNSAELNKVNIKTKFCEDRHHVFADNTMLQHVFVDLFTNAIQSMPAGGDIDVSVTYRSIEGKSNGKGMYYVEIKDNGQGISAEHLPKIFEPFFTTRDDEGGTGLGLSTVYLIVDQHKGGIAVESKLGEGTKFTINLPVGINPNE